MCFLEPLTVKKITGKKALMTNGVEALYDQHIGPLHVNEKVLVFGNLIISKYNPHERTHKV